MVFLSVPYLVQVSHIHGIRDDLFIYHIALKSFLVQQIGESSSFIGAGRYSIVLPWCVCLHECESVCVHARAYM